MAKWAVRKDKSSRLRWIYSCTTWGFSNLPVDGFIRTTHDGYQSITWKWPQARRVHKVFFSLLQWIFSLSLTFYLVFSSLICTLPLHHYPCSFSSLLPHSPTPAPFMALIIISSLYSLHNFHWQLLLFSFPSLSFITRLLPFLTSHLLPFLSSLIHSQSISSKLF